MVVDAECHQKKFAFAQPLNPLKGTCALTSLPTGRQAFRARVSEEGMKHLGN